MSKKSVKPTRPDPSAARPTQPVALSPAPGGLPRTTWVAVALSVFAFLLYANTLGHQYVLDDPLAITKNDLVKKGISGIPELFVRHYRAGTEGAGSSALLYRPLSLVAFAVEWSLAPNSPFFGHLMNVLWYALTVGLLFGALRRLLHGHHWLLAAGATALFAAHPLHTEVVANIKSRDEILNLFFGVAALYGWARWLERPAPKWLFAAVGAYFLALLSKESAVMLLPVFPLASWFFFEKNARQSAGHAFLFAAPAVVFLALRAAVLSQTADNFVVSEMDNPIVAASGFGERSATSFMVLWKYVQLLVFPHPLLSDYSYRHLSVVGWGHWQALAGLALYAGLLALGVLGLIRRQAWAFPIWAFLCGVALYSQLPVVIGTLFGERLMYAPSLWFCLGAAWLVWRVARFDPAQAADLPEAKKVYAGAAILGAAAVLFGLQTIARNPDWKDNRTLFSADVAKAPNSVRLHNGMGSELYTEYNTKAETLSETDAADLLAQIEEHSNAAIAVRPNPVSFLNLGNAAIARNRFADAARHYEEALKLAPNYGLARINLGRTYMAWGREEGQKNNAPARAAELLEKAVEYGMTDPETYLNLGTAYGMSGQNDKAIANFEKATQLNPQYMPAWRNLSIAYRAVGNTAKAEECAQRAAELGGAGE